LDLKCEVRVNGEYWLKDGAAKDAYFSFADMIERASKDSRIVPGDVIGSGTVGGGSIREAIRKGYEKARFLKPGDVVEHHVEGIGVLKGTIGPNAGEDPDYRFQVKSRAPVPELGTAKDYRYQRWRSRLSSGLRIAPRSRGPTAHRRFPFGHRSLACGSGRANG